MHLKKIIGFIFFVLLCNGAWSQVAVTSSIDSSISFKVHGACVQCKTRIEAAVNKRGVKSASWDIETRLLLITYDPSVITLDNIKKRIVAVGHDLDNQKANDEVYKKLPACCHYRELDKISEEDGGKIDHSASTDSIKGIDNLVKGIVLETDAKGIFKPLRGATALWLNSKKGIATDSNGVFILHQETGEDRLIVSYSGYQPDTITVTSNDELKIILGSNKQLKEVTVVSRLRSTYLSNLNPIRTQIMTEKELFKAACCNLSESFETNPSVDVSYNDAVTGSKQIQLLGLSGIYTQLTVENLPGPRGIATPLGLNSIAGPWVESIQLTKGIGSVANGYESIAGQINIELKKPENSERLYANAYINDFGKTDFNLNLSQKIGKKWSVGLLLHDDFLTNKHLDFNKDGFRDLPTGNQFSFINRWKYDDGKGFLMQFGLKLLTDDRTGGEVSFDPGVDKNTTNKYGLGIRTNRYEGFAKIGYVFPAKKYKSIGLQLSAIDHQQDSYFGLTTYNAEQKNFYANLIYQSIIGNTKHKFRTGISFLHDKYDEEFKLLRFKRTEIVLGAFFEYTFTPSDKLSIVAGLRGDNNNLFGSFITPRVHLRYEPVKGTTIRASAGRGQRTANIFAENSSVFVSSRQVNILPKATGKAYGLDPEIGWNKGISVDQKFKLFKHDGLLSLDFFRNDFNNQVVVDLEDPQQVKFYNLEGKSYSNSFQAELNIEPVKNLELRFAYRFFDVRTTYGSKLLQRPMVARNRAFGNLAYATQGWKFDYTINYVGTKRIPGSATNPLPYQRKSNSPDFMTMNAQVSKTIGKKHPMDFYVGAENITGFIQQDAIISADHPFGAYFDASQVWGPLTGRMFYAGWRFKLK